MEKIYCFFGDSVTQASYVKTGWVDLLKMYLEEKYKEDSISVFNLGINGNTTDDVLKRVEAESRARNPSSIIFSIGVNDTKFDNEIQFKKNIKNIIEKAKGLNSDITFIGLVLGNNIIEDNFSLLKTKRYNQIIKEIAESNKCRFIELFDKLEPTDFMDGLHPNEKGHQKMFGEIKKNF